MLSGSSYHRSQHHDTRPRRCTHRTCTCGVFDKTWESGNDHGEFEKRRMGGAMLFATLGRSLAAKEQSAVEKELWSQSHERNEKKGHGAVNQKNIPFLGSCHIRHF